MKKTNGITLIALVITIIILIILAGVAINLTIGENGIFKKAQYAKETTEYASALEILNLKIQEANLKNIGEKKRNCTLYELAEFMSDNSELQIIVKEYNPIASYNGADNLENYINSITGFTVKVKSYEKYLFFIGQTCKVEKVSDDEGIIYHDINDYQGKNNNIEYNVPYEGKGYKFIYDGSLKSAGINGENMQNDLTGGWSTARTPVSCDNGAHYSWYLRIFIH